MSNPKANIPASPAPAGQLTCARILEEELDLRVQADRKYSLRRFAADLRVSPAFLSLVLKGGRRVNESRAREMAARLRFNPNLKRLFVNLARAETAGDEETRTQAIDEVRRQTDRQGLFEPLRMDVFKLISRWYHNAIFSLAGCAGFRDDPKWLAKRLGVSVMEADLAFGRLLRFGMLRREGGRVTQGAAGYSTGDVPSQAIREYHRQVLGLATQALDGQTPEERDYSAVTLALDPDLLPEARELIRNFRRDLTRLAAKGDRRRVYQLAVQFFRLDRPD